MRGYERERRNPLQIEASHLKTSPRLYQYLHQCRTRYGYVVVAGSVPTCPPLAIRIFLITSMPGQVVCISMQILSCIWNAKYFKASGRLRDRGSRKGHTPETESTKTKPPRCAQVRNLALVTRYFASCLRSCACYLLSFLIRRLPQTEPWI